MRTPGDRAWDWAADIDPARGAPVKNLTIPGRRVQRLPRDDQRTMQYAITV